MTAPSNPVSRVLLGVSGGIAAYKSLDLVRRLREREVDVQVVLTPGAERFVAPLSFQALSGRAVRQDLFDPAAEAAMGHIELARWAQRILIAPASADLLARLAGGLADDLLTTVCLASEAPVYVAPAMNRVMWAHPATRANVQTLQAREVVVLGPGAGDQACGEHGAGRMLEPARLAAELLESGRLLAGRHVVITAGPTCEDLDPVRFLGNRSSGTMGFALAAAAARAGARVSLIAGPVERATPPGVARIDVRSAQEMLAAVESVIDGADIFIGCAAVADFRPREAATDKVKKATAPPSIELKPNPDIIARVAARTQRPYTVGFAAETDDLEANARAKLAGKGLDLIAANDVAGGRGFGAGESSLRVLAADGGDWQLGPAPKPVLAHELVRLVAERVETGAGR